VETVGAAGRFRATLVARQWLAPGILEVRLARPAGVDFLPGQFMRILKGDYQRSYSMVSKPDADTIDFCIALVERGRFSQAIRRAAIGDTFYLSGPHGHFVYQGPGNPEIYVATGTGIAPFVAFCRSGVSRGTLLHGVGTPDRLIYRSVLQSALPGYVPCLSRTPGRGDIPEGAFAGRITHYLEQMLAPGTYDFYLCGWQAMIRDAVAIIDDRFDRSRLFVETYD
jgi:ferredoxin-NADP reductase